MMDKLSARLSALAEKATKGPVHLHTHTHFYPNEAIVSSDGGAVAETGLDGEPRHGREKYDATLIVELVNALPTIISALQEKDM